MKTRLRAFILASLALAGATAFAQPTITATGINPQIGETVNVYSGAFQNPGGGGANQTWNLSALAGSPGELYTCVSPSSTTNASSFPNANVAVVAAAAGTRYYATSASALTSWGAVTPSSVFPNSNAEDIVRFPFTNGNTYTDSWASQYTTSVVTYRSGTTTVTADGYGTLTTPAGTFTNVLRVHFVQVYQDSIDFGGNPFIVDYTNDQYMWYKEGIHQQLATVYTLTSTSGLNASGASYFSAGPVAIYNAADLDGSVTLYPNPASDQVTVELELAQNKDVQMLVFNAVGQQVQQLEAGKRGLGVSRLTLDVDQMSEGIYFAKVMLNGQAAATKRFVVAR